jgi:hypothetical protein
MRAYDEAIHLFADEALTDSRRQQLAVMVNDDQVAVQVAGLSLRRLHDLRAWDFNQVASAFSLHTHRETPQRAGAFLENFLNGGSEVLLQDQPLLQLLDQWVSELDENHFVESSPFLRRSFSGFDSVARWRLMERITRGAHESTQLGSETHDGSSEAFERALPLLYQILGISPEPGGHA